MDAECTTKLLRRFNLIKHIRTLGKRKNKDILQMEKGK